MGLLLFAVMIAMNPAISNIHAPVGIADHQAAGTAAKIDAIQLAWQADGVLPLARISIAIDLLFIAVYSWGAWNGGKVMRAVENTANVRRIGWLVMAAALVLLVTDYIETTCQFIQVMQLKGSDTLAGIAAGIRRFKGVAWQLTFVGLLVALLLRRLARRAA